MCVWCIKKPDEAVRFPTNCEPPCLSCEPNPGPLSPTEQYVLLIIESFLQLQFVPF